MVSSLNATDEDVMPSGCLRPIRWSFLTFVYLLGLKFEQQGHHIPRSCSQIPLFLFCLANMFSHFV